MEATRMATVLDAQQAQGHEAPPVQEKPYKVITVRMTQSLHRRLKDAAHDQRTSLNRLCVQQLLAAVDETPAEMQTAGTGHEAA